MRLRVQGRCNFENIKDQIIIECNSEKLRQKILQRGGDESLYSIILEAVSDQQECLANEKRDK